MNKDLFEKIFKDKLLHINLEINQTQIDIFWNYMKFLLKENYKYNLTGIDDPEAVIDRHFIDSLLVFNEIEFEAGEKVMDVGTGAGFPGMVLKIYFPFISLLLLDSRMKRINFLRLLLNKSFFIEPFSKNIEIIQDRAEKLGQDKSFREKFDWVFSRAVAPMNILCEYTLPFVNIGKKCILYKGKKFKKELDNAKKALKVLGGEVIDVKKVNIINNKSKRFLILIKKTSETPPGFPRRTGIPKKRPL
ncbi:MAG: 16S rRNA (guanine(527)-N(7))-methyltransferase RsmG [Bacillota bacterium]